MRHFSYLLLIFVVAGLSGLAGCGGKKVQPSQPTAQPQALFRDKCSRCHALNVALEENHTLEGWRQRVALCASRWVWSINSQEQEIISRYVFDLRPADQEPPPPPPQPEPVHHKNEYVKID
ncbi:MAG: hypothetical protein JRJ59_04210 [Deltaproteobacteria bacterium]|nr:hypothetical protein [Deltaproteobacteria bacterium]